MEYGSRDGGEDDEHNDVSLVDTSKIFVMQDTFSERYHLIEYIIARSNTHGIKYTMFNELVALREPRGSPAGESTSGILCILFHEYWFLLLYHTGDSKNALNQTERCLKIPHQ